eukprot:3745339-Rhodomonas_salina.1
MSSGVLMYLCSFSFSFFFLSFYPSVRYGLAKNTYDIAPFFFLHGIVPVQKRCTADPNSSLVLLLCERQIVAGKDDEPHKEEEREESRHRDTETSGRESEEDDRDGHVCGGEREGGERRERRERGESGWGRGPVRHMERKIDARRQGDREWQGQRGRGRQREKERERA